MLQTTIFIRRGYRRIRDQLQLRLTISCNSVCSENGGLRRETGRSSMVLMYTRNSGIILGFTKRSHMDLYVSVFQHFVRIQVIYVQRNLCVGGRLMRVTENKGLQSPHFSGNFLLRNLRISRLDNFGKGRARKSLRSVLSHLSDLDDGTSTFKKTWNGNYVLSTSIEGAAKFKWIFIVD